MFSTLHPQIFDKKPIETPKINWAVVSFQFSKSWITIFLVYQNPHVEAPPEATAFMKPWIVGGRADAWGHLVVGWRIYRLFGAGFKIPTKFGGKSAVLRISFVIFVGWAVGKTGIEVARGTMKMCEGPCTSQSLELLIASTVCSRIAVATITTTTTTRTITVNHHNQNHDNQNETKNCLS